MKGKEDPLKNVGFQKNRGATPHFRNSAVNRIEVKVRVVAISYIEAAVNT
jgi:hypothetical protein